jgi:hypothetical protein
VRLMFDTGMYADDCFLLCLLWQPGSSAIKEGDDVTASYRSGHVTCPGPGTFQPYIDDCHDT